MQHSHSQRTNIWSKMRSSTKQLSSSLANLSLRTEHDGDTEDSTLIHKALIHHYVKNNEPFPEWLGVSIQQQQHYYGQEQQQQQQHHQQPHHQQRTNHSAPPSTSSGSSVADKYRRTPASSSFKDIYNRSGSVSAPSSTQPLHQQHSAPVTGSSRPMWGQSTQDNGSQQSASSDSRNAMRDRLKRNNYRSNFGV